MDSKLILKDKTEIPIEPESWLGCIVTYIDGYDAFADIAKKLTDDSLKNIVIQSDSADAGSFLNTTLEEPNFEITNDDKGIKVVFRLRELTEAEVIAPLAETAAEMLTDEQALQVKGLYPVWESLIGETVKTGTRFTYSEDLYKVITPDDLLIQEQFIPGQGTSAIYSRISDGTVPGTLDEPIDVPADVTTNAFTYVTGKYYRWNDQIYKCEREGDEDGVEYSFAYSPDQLVGQYFTVIEGEA